MDRKLKQIANKITKQHSIKMEQAFYKKFDEYSKLSLEELKALFNHPDKKIRPGGIHKRALVVVVENKLREQREAKLNEAIGELPKEEVKEAEIENNPETKEE